VSKRITRRVGLDLDNTLVSYDRVFLEGGKALGYLPLDFTGGKEAVKRRVLRADPLFERWQELQGYVYGKLMHRAILMPGAGRFLLRCRQECVQVFIVSHKTVFGHFDESKTPLREVALDWLENNGFFDSDVFGLNRQDVYFESTRPEKVAKIAELKPTHFVDDLPAVFAEPDFPADIAKILIRPPDVYGTDHSDLVECSSWANVSYSVFGDYGESEEANLFLARQVAKDPSLRTCSLINSGGNSHVYRVEGAKHQTVAMKRYPDHLDDSRDRIGVESAASKFLWQNGIRATPRLIKHDQQLNVAIFEWLNGEPVLSPTSAQIVEIADFARKLWELRELEAAKELPNASEACLSGQSLIDQIQIRRKNLINAENQFAGLSNHFRANFDPTWQEAQRRARLLWPSSQGFSEQLPQHHQTLSPADFGFHNAILSPKKKLQIIDLEYFGWDDPVKLVSEFCWHPGMTLDARLQEVWLDKSTAIFGEAGDFRTRLKALFPLYGVRWALIVLNKFLTASRDSTKISSADLEEQLEKSVKLCERVGKYLHVNGIGCAL